MKQGFVTFADIMGWKGIWLKNQGSEKQILQDLLDIKEILDLQIESIKNTDGLEGLEVSIKLISDTFVVFSNYEADLEKEFEIHSVLVKELTLMALEKKLMIRGATSFGKYLTNDMSFVGPAIDEAASWHEQAESVSIFLSPTALLKVNCLNTSYWQDRSLELKKMRLNTKVLDWKEYYKSDFQEIFYDNSPIVPEISKKYLNTLEYLNAK